MHLIAFDMQRSQDCSLAWTAITDRSAKPWTHLRTNESIQPLMELRSLEQARA